MPTTSAKRKIPQNLIAQQYQTVHFAQQSQVDGHDRPDIFHSKHEHICWANANAFRHLASCTESFSRRGIPSPYYLVPTPDPHLPYPVPYGERRHFASSHTADSA